MIRALAALALLAAGCLPRQSLSRREEVPAQLYDLTVDVDVRTEGAPIPPFRWHLDGAVGWSYTRTFRDGSLGHLVRFERLDATITREGGSPVAAPPRLAGALAEVRSFPDGEVLSIRGVSRWMGEGGHAEVVDFLWPLLSPHLPSTREEAEGFVTSWPTWVPNGPRVRTRLEAKWSPDGDGWRYAGTLAASGGPVTATGEASGTLLVGDRDVRVREHTFAMTRAVTTRWATGATVVQTWAATGALRHRGEGEAPPLEPLGEADSRATDAEPVRLRDGRVVTDDPVDIAAVLPFLFVPDDLEAPAREQVRSLVIGAGSMGGEVPPP